MTSSKIMSQTSIKMSSRSSASQARIGQEEINRVKEEIFNRIKTELGARGCRPTIQYEPLKIAQDPFTASILAVELPKGFKGPRINKYDGSADPVDHATSYHDAMRQA